MKNLNEVSLLDMTRVNTRFRAVAKEAFSKKYTGKSNEDYFELRVFCENELEEYRRYAPFFRMFGENMMAIDIRFFDQSAVAPDHWLIGLMQRYCTSLAKLSINSGQKLDLTSIMSSTIKSTLTHMKLVGLKFLDNLWTTFNYPNLISFTARQTIDREIIEPFLQNNQQIQELDLSYCRFDFSIFRLLNDRMNALTTLRIYDFTPMPPQDFEVIKLKSLEIFELSVDPERAAAALTAISEGCLNLELLFVRENSNQHLLWEDGCIEAIRQLDRLKSLIICSRNLGLIRLNKIIESLPKLSSLSLKHFNVEFGIYDNIPEVVESCLNLNKLAIEVCSDPPELTSDFLSQIASTSRNNPNMRLTLERNLKLVSYRGEVRSHGVIIYWDGYDPALNQSKYNLLDLNEKCLDKIIGFLDQTSQCDFHDTCKRAKKLVSKHISKNVFYASLATNDRIIAKFGKHIRRMNLDINGIIHLDNENNTEIIESWRDLNQLCTKVTELTITSIFYVLNDVRRIPILRWANLRKLVFATPYPVSNRVLRSFICPLLTYLDVQSFVGDYNGFETLSESNNVGTYDNLTTLKVCVFVCFHFDDSNNFYSFISLAATMKMLEDFYHH